LIWKLSQEELFAQCAAVTACTSLPVFANNLPNNTGLNIDSETIDRPYGTEEFRAKGKRFPTGADIPS